MFIVDFCKIKYNIVIFFIFDNNLNYVIMVLDN